MRLKQQDIELIIHKILETWQNEESVEMHLSQHETAKYLSHDFSKELSIEDDLNQEVEKMLEQFSSQFDSGELNRTKMFAMVKKQLAKEKGIIL